MNGYTIWDCELCDEHRPQTVANVDVMKYGNEIIRPQYNNEIAGVPCKRAFASLFGYWLRRNCGLLLTGINILKVFRGQLTVG